ncbi:hypothetical protein [Streptomyces sp. NPDC054849]
MGDVIGPMLPSAVGIAISPMPLIAVILTGDPAWPCQRSRVLGSKYIGDALSGLSG